MDAGQRRRSVRGPAPRRALRSLRARRGPAALLAVLVATALAVAACGGDGPAGDDRPSVVVSTGLIAELATRVAGDDAAVHPLIPAGVDLHSFDPPPGAARLVAGADLVIVNGYRLEESLLDVILENRRDQAPLVVAARGVDVLEDPEHAAEHAAEDGGAAGSDLVDALATASGDPHAWLDVAGARRYVENIRDALVRVDPARADGYRARAATEIAALDALDAELRATLDAVPVAARRLVVFHAAFAYFARAYGFEMAAALLPASPNQQLAAGALAALVEEVRALGVRAVFAEPQFARDVVEALARETGTRVLTLHSTLGPGAEDYATMMRANAAAIVEGLGE